MSRRLVWTEELIGLGLIMRAQKASKATWAIAARASAPFMKAEGESAHRRRRFRVTMASMRSRLPSMPSRVQSYSKSCLRYQPSLRCTAETTHLVRLLCLIELVAHFEQLTRHRRSSQIRSSQEARDILHRIAGRIDELPRGCQEADHRGLVPVSSA